MLVSYPAERRRNLVSVADCLATGANGRLASEAECQPGTTLADGPAVFFGIAPETAHLVQAARDRGRWWYADKAYFGRASRRIRVTSGAYQHDGRSGGYRMDRLRDLGVTIEPWRRVGGHVVVALQSERFLRLAWRIDREAWLADVLARLRAATDRPIVVREKGTTPLAADLADAWAVVAHSSNALVEAACAGVPIFATECCAAAPMARTDLADIERPRYADFREEWAARLAANQWTLEEIVAGVWWRMVGEG